MNQKERVYNYLRRRPKLGGTTLEMVGRLKIVDPLRRIRELKDDGHEITKTLERRSMSEHKVYVYRLKELA